MTDPTAALLALELMPGLACNPNLLRLWWWRLLAAPKRGALCARQERQRLSRYYHYPLRPTPSAPVLARSAREWQAFGDA